MDLREAVGDCGYSLLLVSFPRPEGFGAPFYRFWVRVLALASAALQTLHPRSRRRRPHCVGWLVRVTVFDLLVKEVWVFGLVP